ncbi:uncharacterized protein [Bemisia tabaci]|nr:PREDICTED: uncharacterized protein LOC109033115 [Bemisia tabaci]
MEEKPNGPQPGPTEAQKDMVWSGDSDLLEEWNFVVHTNKLNATEETASDGESVEILSREKIGDPAVEAEEHRITDESNDGDQIDSDNESNADDEEGDENLRDEDEECNNANADDDQTGESSTQIVPTGIFPEENLIPTHPMETALDTVSARSEWELERRIILVSGLVIFIGWLLLFFPVRSQENIDKIKLENDLKWQAMNEKYSSLMQELAIYKMKSQLIDSSLNDLKTLQKGGKAASCQFDDEKWQQMHEKYLKLEKDLTLFKEKSDPLDDVKNSVRNRMKHPDSSFSPTSRNKKSDCGSDKSSYCIKDGEDVPQHSEILRLIKQLDSRPELEKSSHEVGEEPEFFDLRGKFFNIKRAFEISDSKSFEEDFEKLYEVLSVDKDDFIGIDLNLITRYNEELYESFLALMDVSEKFTKYLKNTDPRFANDFDDLARISYEYILSNLQKSNYNIAKLVNNYDHFAKAVSIDISYSSRRFGQKRLKKEREWKSKNGGSKESFDDNYKRKSKDKEESFHINPEFLTKLSNEVLENFHRVSILNEKIRELLEKIPQSVKDADNYVQIVSDRIRINLNDADIVLSRFISSFDSLLKKGKTDDSVKNNYRKDYKEKEDFKVHKKRSSQESFHNEQENLKVYKKKSSPEASYNHPKYENRFNQRRDSHQHEGNEGSSESSEDQEEKLRESYEQNDGNVFKFIKSKINNYQKFFTDKAANFNKKLKNHTMRVKEKFQKKFKSVLDFEKAKKLNEKIMSHGSKIKNKLTQKFDSLWDSVSKKLKNATNMAVASSEWLFDFGDDRDKQDSAESKEEANVDLNNNNWMFKRAEFRNSKREDTAYWYFRRGNARRRNVEKYKEL